MKFDCENLYRKKSETVMVSDFSAPNLKSVRNVGKLHRFKLQHSFLKDIVVIFLQKLFFRNFLSLT